MKFFEFLIENNILKLDEALPYSIAKKYVGFSKNQQYKNLYPELFSSGKDRIEIPFKWNPDQKISNTQREVENKLKSAGYSNIDYKNNKAEQGKQQFKIGKLLYKIDPELAEDYKKDKTYQPENLTIILSRHPYDLAGMSTNREWTSCMNIYDKRKYKNCIKADIKQGTLIAYLVKDSDKNINNPLARVNVKPLKDKLDNVIFETEGKVYATTGLDEKLEKQFQSTVKKIY